MSSGGFPPTVQGSERVVLFDGLCKLCNGWARFLIRHDRRRLFRLASAQSAQGQAMLAWFELPLERFDTLAYVEGRQLYVRSDAVLRILGQLEWPWRALGLLRICPRRLRDWLYDRVAQNRYTLFGCYDRCTVPDADHAGRFLHD